MESNEKIIRQKKYFADEISAIFNLGSISRARLNIIRFCLLFGSVASLGLINLPLTVHIIVIFFTAFSLALSSLLEKRGSKFRLWSIYLISFFLFVHLRSYADDTIFPVLFQYAINIEKSICFGKIPSVQLQKVFYSGKIDNWVLITTSVWGSYFILPHFSVLYCWKFKEKHVGRYVTAYILTYYLGLMIYFVLPTAPPWAASENEYIFGCRRILTDLGMWVNYKAYLIIYQLIGEPNNFAAMPSVHMGITCIIAFIANDMKIILIRYAGIFYCILMAFSLIFLGEHYFIDIIAGIIIGGVAWLLSKKIWSYGFYI